MSIVNNGQRKNRILVQAQRNQLSWEVDKTNERMMMMSVESMENSNFNLFDLFHSSPWPLPFSYPYSQVNWTKKEREKLKVKLLLLVVEVEFSHVQ